MKELKNLKDCLEEMQSLEEKYEDIQILLEMAYEESDPSMVDVYKRQL